MKQGRDAPGEDGGHPGFFHDPSQSGPETEGTCNGDPQGNSSLSSLGNGRCQGIQPAGQQGRKAGYQNQSTPNPAHNHVHNLLLRYTIILYVGKNWKITEKSLEIPYKSSEKYKKYLTHIVSYATI